MKHLSFLHTFLLFTCFAHCKNKKKTADESFTFKRWVEFLNTKNGFKERKGFWERVPAHTSLVLYHCKPMANHNSDVPLHKFDVWNSYPPYGLASAAFSRGQFLILSLLQTCIFLSFSPTGKSANCCCHLFYTHTHTHTKTPQQWLWQPS